ncbi:MAG: hypothetical protein R3F61_31960 [Myxococcota bacterium]
MVWVAVALTGCSWLFEVPEDRIPIRSEAPREANRVSNQVKGPDGYIDPTMAPKLSTELETNPGLADDDPEAVANGGKPRWDPVSRPVEPKEEKPFVFQTSSGTKIKSHAGAAYDGYPTAEELKVSEEKRRQLIESGEVTNRYRD